jgi:hypothetical protein
MTRKRIFGVLGVAATLSLPATISAQATTTTSDVSAPQSPDTASLGISAHHDATVTPYYGTNKLHFGVKLADGSYDTAHPPKLDGATFQIVETGTAVAGGVLNTTCTMDLGADPGDTNPFPNEVGYHYFCDLHPNDPSYPNGYYTYFVQGADRIHVHQLTAPTGVQKDPLTREPTQCVFPGDPSGGSCSTLGWHLDFIDRGDKPTAANFSNLVNHGQAQTIDAIAKSQTAGATPSLTITKQPAHGTAVIRSNKIVYTPKKTYGGADAFTYTLKTAYGSSLGTVGLLVQVPPLARPDRAHTTGKLHKKGKAVSTAVLGNDLARGGGALKGLTITAGPQHGTARVSGQKIVYTPGKGYHGQDALTYLIKNKYGSAKAKLTITVAKP